MALIVKKPWSTQPQVAAGIDWANPITLSLFSALDAMTGTDRVTGRLMTLVSNPSKAPGVKGIGYVGNNASYGYVTIPQTLGAMVTIVYIASGVARTANANLIAGLGATSGNQLCGFQVQNTQSNRALLRQTNGGGASLRNYNVNTSSTGVPAVLALSFSDSSSTNSKVYWNGILDQGTPLDGSSGANTTFDTFAIGGVKRSTDTGADAGNNGALALLFNRVLSDTEIKSLSDNPWQIFAPLQRTLWAGALVVVTIGRPGSDITTTGWTGVPDNTDKYTNIDEASASDTDYIFSPPVTGTVAPIIFGIEDQTGAINTLPAGTWDVNVRSRFSEGLTASQIRVTLLDSGGTSVGASSWQTVTASFADYVLSITTTGIAARIKIEAQ